MPLANFRDVRPNYLRILETPDLAYRNARERAYCAEVRREPALAAAWWYLAEDIFEDQDVSSDLGDLSDHRYRVWHKTYPGEDTPIGLDTRDQLAPQDSAMRAWGLMNLRRGKTVDGYLNRVDKAREPKPKWWQKR
jgi:hypothetical protein